MTKMVIQQHPMLISLMDLNPIITILSLGNQLLNSNQKRRRKIIEANKISNY